MDEPKEHEYRSIAHYVEAQIGEGVEATFVQRMNVRRVLGELHEVWDVHTSDGGRWWVITNLTNLYLQDHFPSFEEALTYHVGLRVVMSERSRKELDSPDKEAALGGAWRRFEQAVNAYNQAQEAEEYQAVGIHCRQALLSSITAFRDSP